MVLEKPFLPMLATLSTLYYLQKTNSIELIFLFFLSDITCDTDATFTGLHL